MVEYQLLLALIMLPFVLAMPLFYEVPGGPSTSVGGEGGAPSVAIASSVAKPFADAAYAMNVDGGTTGTGNP